MQALIHVIICFMVSTFNQNAYLDYAATTPLDPRVLDAMLPHLEHNFGNPSSIHYYGQKAEAAVENSRFTIAEVFNCLPEEIVFTACGSESDNLALRGSALAARRDRNANHILISPVEHHAVSATAEQLAEVFGFELEYLPVNPFGQVDPGDVAARIRSDTAVVSVIFANNEIGSINPVAEIGAVCCQKGVTFHTDAVQAAAHLPIDTQTLQADLIAVGAHKLYGPKGIGALYIRKGTELISTLTGGGQERALRAGTSNIAYIVGQAEAFRLASQERTERHAKSLAFRDRIINHVLETIPDSKLTGHPSERLPNHASFVFKYIDGNELLVALDAAGFACSSGSACKTGNPEPSEVLIAIDISPDWALGSLRVTVGMQTTEDQVTSFLETLPKTIAKVRALASR